jgi:hypothetical protein
LGLKRGFFPLIAMAAMTSAAMADCRTIGMTFRLSRNDSVSTTGTLTKGSACSIGFRAGGTAHFTSGSIASRPSHGSLTQAGELRFVYKPAAGFKGVDRYSLRVCGTDRAGSGCATLTYDITVE